MTDKLFRVVWKFFGNEADGRFFVGQDGELRETDRDGMDYVDGLYDRDWSTGFHDSTGAQVFANDLVAFHHSYWTHSDGSPITGVVTWDQKMGAWTLVNTENSKFRVLLSKHIGKGTVTGRKA